MIRRDQAEKMEIIHPVEHSNLSVKRTLEELNVPRGTFYRWYYLSTVLDDFSRYIRA